jgi:hypothetical protein
LPGGPDLVTKSAAASSAPAPHVLTVRLDLSDGSSPTASVAWQVRADTEP